MIYAKNNLTNEISIFPQDDIIEGYTELSEEEIIQYELQRAKDIKIAENDRIRDDALNQGVVYNNVLFDSDIDQKVNLSDKYDIMSDMDTVVWYGKDNKGLLCTKNDLLAIRNLITKLHSYCWENNAYIKEQIAEATTLDEVNNINISYKDF